MWSHGLKTLLGLMYKHMGVGVFVLGLHFVMELYFCVD